MTTMKVRKRTSYTVLFPGHEREYAVRIEPSQSCCYHPPIVERLPDGRLILGYLADDTDCENPLDSCDGSGKIYDRRRGLSSKDKFYEEMGFDEDGNRIGKTNPFAVLLDVYEHSGEAWRVHGGGTYFPDEQWDVSNQAGVWVPDESCLEHIQSSAVLGCLPKGTKVEYRSVYNEDGTCKVRPIKPGEHDYFGDGTRPDERYNNVITYVLPDGRSQGGFKSFNSSARAAARILKVKLDKKALEKGKRAIAVQCAEQAVEEFNKWLSGEVYGICVRVFDADGEPIEEYDDEVWGHVGVDWAMEALADAVKCTKRHLLEMKETSE